MINFLDYKNYRVPFIDEFTPGLIYYYEEVRFKKKLPLITPSKCKVQIGSMILEGRILESNKNQTAKITIIEKIPNQSYFDNTLKYSNLSLNEYPIKYLYDYEGYEKTFVNIPTESTRIIKKGIWGTAFGIQKKEHLKDLIDNNKIWVKGYIINKYNPSLNQQYPWISAYYPDNENHIFNNKYKSSIFSTDLKAESLFIFTKIPKFCLLYYKKKGIIKCNYIEEIYKYQYLKPFKYILYYPVNGYYLTKEIKNLEELKPMKSLYTEVEQDNQLIQILKGYKKKEHARNKLKKLRPELTKEDIKTIVNNIWDDKQPIEIKMMNQHHLISTNIKRKQFSISYALNGEYTNKNNPQTEITKSISAISVEAAIRRLIKYSKDKIRRKHIIRISEVHNNIYSKPTIEVLFEKRHKTTQEILLKKYNKRFKKSSKVKKQNKVTLSENRLICIRHIETNEVKRLSKQEALPYIEDMWVYTSKTFYKRQQGKTKKITQPKIVKVLSSECICKTGKKVKEKVPITYTKCHGKVKNSDGTIDYLISEHKSFTWKLKEEVQQKIKDAKKLELNLIEKHLENGKNPKKHAIHQACRISIVEPTIPFTQKVESITPPKANIEKQAKKMAHKAKKDRKKTKIVSLIKPMEKRFKLNRLKKRYFKSVLKRRRIRENTSRKKE